MSTVVGVACAGGVVLAGDRVVADADRIRTRGQQHVHEFERVGVGVAVVCDDVEGFADGLDAAVRAYRTDRGSPRIDAAARLVGDVAGDFDAVALVAARDDEGRPALRSVDPGGGVTEEDVAALGGGAALALGGLEAGYDPDASLDDAATLARDAVVAAAERDPGTGTEVDTFRLPA